MGDTYLCESPFFRDPKHLTLHITQATWLAPEREYVALDLERGTALDALPEDMHLSVHRIGRQVGLALIAPDPPGQYGDVPRLLSALRRPLPFARRGDARPELLQHHFLRRPLVGDGG